MMLGRFADDHARAGELSYLRVAGALSQQDGLWLDSHLANCPECAEQAEETLALVSTLKTVSVNAQATLVQNTQREIRNLCLQARQRRRRLRPVWISSAVASVWMACATPYLWQSFDMTGHWLHIPDLLWQMGFLVSWFTPAMTAAAVALWLRPQAAKNGRAPMNSAAA